MRLTRYALALLLCLLGLPMTSSWNCGAAALDQYGGISNVRCPSGAKAHFYQQKMGDRWWLCDPAGLGFFMKGVAVVEYNIDQEQQKLNDAKYATGLTSVAEYNWALEMVRRLQAWGFNTVADNSVNYTWATNADSRWTTADGTISLKLPFVYKENTTLYSFTNRAGCAAPSPLKDLMNGVSSSAYSGYRYNYGDYFDPNFSSCVAGILQYTSGGPTLHQVANAAHNDYLLYATIDESDNTGGLLGAGPDFPTLPAGHFTQAHPAWTALVTAPTQASNNTWQVTYADTAVYTKRELINWLAPRYKNNIASLNAAWGSNYTSFGSTGAWGSGTGLLDENGACPSKSLLQTCWVGDPLSLAGETNAMQADMSTFYVHYLDRYFSIMQSQWHNPTYGAPGVMLQMLLGSWSSPPRREVLTEASKYLELPQLAGIPPAPWNCATASGGTCSDSQQRIDFVSRYLGDRPWITWEGIDANPDSAESQHTSGVGSPYSTQAQRGAGYKGMVAAIKNAKSKVTNTYPIVGFYWWGAFDEDGEGLNWGLITPHDNPYDGCSATIAGCGKDQWGYPTGGERKNYGDFISAVKAANEDVVGAK